MKARLRALAGRAAISAVIFYLAFVGIVWSRDHSLGSALVGAFVVEAIFVAAISVFVGIFVLLAAKTMRRRDG